MIPPHIDIEDDEPDDGDGSRDRRAAVFLVALVAVGLVVGAALLLFTP